MNWILHDSTHRAVIGMFASREEAESWRDSQGLGALLIAAPHEATPESVARAAHCPGERRRELRRRPHVRR